MSETILSAEPAIRLSIFLGVLAAMALWEVAAPRRRREIPRVIRWTNNLGLVVLDTVILRLTFPIVAVGLAVMAEDRGWGLFNNIDAPVWVAIVVSMLLLDLAIYLQHVMFQAIPGLWRLHRMHHADLDFDATTGLRFHPVEILISMGISWRRSRRSARPLSRCCCSRCFSTPQRSSTMPTSICRAPWTACFACLS